MDQKTTAKGAKDVEPARLAIVGASVRAAAASAVRAGFQVLAADLFADQDLCELATATTIDDYPAGLAAWLRSLEPGPDAWMYTGALENHPDLVDEMAAIAPLWGNRGDVLRQVRSPWQIAETLRTAKLLFPAMQRTPEGLPCDGSWLAKTGRGASGSGVTSFRGQTGKKVIYQQRIRDIPCSAVYVAAGGRSALLGVVRQLVGESWLHAAEFQFCGAIGPWPLTEDASEAVGRIGEVLAARFGLSGMFGVDFVLDHESRVWAIEVNPRYPASAEIIECAMGIEAIAAHAAACCAEQLPIVPLRSALGYYGKAILFARQTLTIAHNLLGESRVPRADGVWSSVADIPTVNTTCEAGQPIMTLFAGGVAPESVSENLASRVALIERELYSS